MIAIKNMKKKILCLLLLFPILFNATIAEEASTGFDIESITEDYFIVINAERPGETVLRLEREADTECYPASTTKVMTCIVALESGIDWETPVKITSAADSDRVLGSAMGIHKKETYSFGDLLYGMMLPSGNDAAIALSIAVAGNVSDFVAMMNDKAAALGMAHTHFTNPNGLHDENHYSTARDMSILAAYAMQNEQFRQIVSTTEYTAVSKAGRTLRLRSSNRFLRDYVSTTFKPASVLYAEAIGIKTGETNAAGKCLIAAAQRNETVYIICLFHGEMPPSGLSDKKQDPYSVKRYQDARALFEYVFENDMRSVSLQSLIDAGLPCSLHLEHDPNTELLLSSDYIIEWNTDAVYTAPLYAFPTNLLSDQLTEDMIQILWQDTTPKIGEEAGTAILSVNDTTLFSAPIRCTNVVHPTPPPTPVPTPIPTPEAIITAIDTEKDVPTVSPAPSPSPNPADWWLSCAPKAD